VPGRTLLPGLVDCLPGGRVSQLGARLLTLLVSKRWASGPPALLTDKAAPALTSAGSAGAGRRRWDSNPPLGFSSGAGRRCEGPSTCRFILPVVTARARREPGVPGVTRTQHGPRPGPVLVADASGAPVLRDQGPDRPAGHGKADASLDRPPACKARSGGIVTLGNGDWRRSRQCGVVRGCPLGTGQDRCEWHASGPAG
jgi:hypothetical protein